MKTWFLYYFIYKWLHTILYHFNSVLIAMSADALEPLGARASAGTVMTLYFQPALAWQTNHILTTVINENWDRKAPTTKTALSSEELGRSESLWCNADLSCGVCLVYRCGKYTEQEFTWSTCFCFWVKHLADRGLNKMADFADDIFWFIFVNMKCWIWNKISPNLSSGCLIHKFTIRQRWLRMLWLDTKQETKHCLRE